MRRPGKRKKKAVNNSAPLNKRNGGFRYQRRKGEAQEKKALKVKPIRIMDGGKVITIGFVGGGFCLARNERKGAPKLW